MERGAGTLMMTGPGLALFTAAWCGERTPRDHDAELSPHGSDQCHVQALVGYSPCASAEMGRSSAGFRTRLLCGVGADPNPDYAGTIPQATFMIYQLMFAIITPALITGATAERMEVSGTGLFLTLWFLVVTRAAGLYGLGEGRVPKRVPRRKVSYAGFCRRNSRAHPAQVCVRHFGVRALPSESGPAGDHPPTPACRRILWC